ncbi:NACHT, LRR and PYD domains-containing protein 3-like [Engraulis encrasicolus]|uniref:NACHT, LRR and PYD domains-containing protein 3-like n=1 Tax=Engraulis encrasicolus TaxID=184585 RepID=UPI002FD451A1
MSSPGNQESQLGQEPAGQSEESHRFTGKKPDTGVPRAPSMSDLSRATPPNMAEGERVQEIGCEPDTSGQDKQRDLHHIFEELEKKIMTFVNNELQRFKQILSPDYQENFEMKSEDESDAREGALKMALQFLCNMKYQDLADKLNENEMDVCCQNSLKRNLKNKYQVVFEGIAKQGSSVLLEEIYTDLYITEGGSGKVNEEHEVRQIEYRSKRPAGQDKPIKCADIFKPSPHPGKTIRRVLTKGVAGIGKTISVHKYILDWAEGKDNKDINFIFPLCFRELNLMRENECSLMDLLQHFFPDLKKLKSVSLDKHKVLFVFDGLDECRFHLNFQRNESLTDMAVMRPLDVILTNLLQGNLIPSALLWITTRPAAASKIPPGCVDLVTEVQGFNDSQKEEYFRKKINDDRLASDIISHIKSSRSLHIMCYIPVFSWIVATVLEMIYSSEHKQIPKTLTELYTYFLIFQSKQSNIKYGMHAPEAEWKKPIKPLGKLAYEQLEKGNLIFYEDDLRECGLDVKEAADCSGLCTQIFREESGIFLGTVFCFVHLSVQEYLAALYAVLSMAIEGTDIISLDSAPPMTESLINLHKSAVDKSLAYDDGRFDLFLRFLLGLSLETNQTLLHGLMSRGQRDIKVENQNQANDETIRYIKDKIKQASSPERMINLFHCLNELKDQSLLEGIQSFLRAGASSPGQWSALVFVLLTSDQNLDVFDLKKYIRSDEALLRLIQVVEESHTTLVDSCGLTEQSCAALASLLNQNMSKLRKLDLSDNCIGDVGLQQLCDGLKSPNCVLETLRVKSCGFTEQSCTEVASVLCKESSQLRELNLGGNPIGDEGVQRLTSGLKSPNCALETLGVI